MCPSGQCALVKFSRLPKAAATLLACCLLLVFDRKRYPSKQRPYIVCIYIFICCRSQNRKPQQRPLPTNQPFILFYDRPDCWPPTTPKITAQSNQPIKSSINSINQSNLSQTFIQRGIVAVSKEAMTTGGSCCFQRSHDNEGGGGGAGPLKRTALKLNIYSFYTEPVLVNELS